MTWYHVSTENLGKSVTMHPRTPLTISDGESKTPRICVCPSVAQCLIAMPGTGDRVYIYAAKGTPRPAPRSVWDRATTEEHWFLDPVEFTRVGIKRVSPSAEWLMLVAKNRKLKAHERWRLTRKLWGMIGDPALTP